MKEIAEKFIRSVYGGVMVSFGGTVYLSSDNKYIGALLFSMGLFAICEFGFGLFTGKIGNLLFRKKEYIIELLLTLLGNLAGCLAMGGLVSIAAPSLVSKAAAVCTLKLSETPLQNFILAMMCGVMMFIAVETYKTKTGAAKYLGIFIAVPLFITCGFEHSVANMFYFTLGGVNAAQFAPSVIVTVLGNAVGSIVFSLFKFYDKNHKTA